MSGSYYELQLVCHKDPAKVIAEVNTLLESGDWTVVVVSCCYSEKAQVVRVTAVLARVKPS